MVIIAYMRHMPHYLPPLLLPLLIMFRLYYDSDDVKQLLESIQNREGQPSSDEMTTRKTYGDFLLLVMMSATAAAQAPPVHG